MGDQSETDYPEISEGELQLRVVYSLFGPVAKLTRRFMLPLKKVRSFFEVACYHELKRASHTLQESADRLGVSRRKVAHLSKRLKQNFFEPEQSHGLPRRIEYMLWAGPMTEGRIHQALPDQDEADVERALETLRRQERVEILQTQPTYKYGVPESEFRLYEDNWMARIDGLNNLLANLADVVIGRFFEDDDRSFARTLNFRMRREDLDQLRRLYEEEMYPRFVELENQVEGAADEEVVEMSLSVFWAPTELAESSSGDSD